MEHKHMIVDDIQITNEGGIIIYFDDGSHTYIIPETAKWIYDNLYEEE